jgi:hypothetical protein
MSERSCSAVTKKEQHLIFSTINHKYAGYYCEDVLCIILKRDKEDDDHTNR